MPGVRIILPKKQKVESDKNFNYKQSDEHLRSRYKSKKAIKAALPMKTPIEMKSAMEVQGSPYMLYGEKASPATMQGESPIAKYGCSKKMKRSK